MIAALLLSTVLVAEPKWEYHRELIQTNYYGDTKAIHSDIDNMVKLGQNGWELVAVACYNQDCSWHVLYFKRKKK